MRYLKRGFAELEAPAQLNRLNSGKPPSSDGLKKPARVTSCANVPARKRAGRRVTKARHCDRSLIPTPSSISLPAGLLDVRRRPRPETSVGHSVRQVFDLPEPAPLVVTEHLRTIANAPPAARRPLAVSAGRRTRPCNTAAQNTAFVIYLLHYQLLPENRLAALMADLFGVKVAAATIARMSRTCAERLQGFAQNGARSGGGRAGETHGRDGVSHSAARRNGCMWRKMAWW